MNEKTKVTPPLRWKEDKGGFVVGFLESDPGTSLYIITPVRPAGVVRLSGAFIPDKADGSRYGSAQAARAAAEKFLKIWWAKHFLTQPALSAELPPGIGRPSKLYVPPPPEGRELTPEEEKVRAANEAFEKGIPVTRMATIKEVAEMFGLTRKVLLNFRANIAQRHGEKQGKES